jgi:hypothetical protein
MRSKRRSESSGNSRTSSNASFIVSSRVFSTLTTSCLGLTVYVLNCLNVQAIHRSNVPASLTPPASSDVAILAHFTDTTAVEPDLVALFEKTHFYTGVSDIHPDLFYRSDLLKERHSAIPEKTTHGVSDKILNPIWRSTVDPGIIALLKEEKRDIHVSSILLVRFSTPGEDGKPVFGPIVIWISVHRNTTTPAACRDASPEIIRILEPHGVTGAVVHWIEGSVEPLAGPPMMGLVNDTNPTAYIRRALTAALGIPLFAEDMKADNSHGSLGFFFHENKDNSGNKSERVFAVTNKHVVSKVTNTD